MTARTEPTTPTPEIALAVSACLDKKALDLVVLDLRGLATFTDTFVICHGTSSRHVHAIVDAIEERLRQGRRLVEGYSQGEWVLMDFGDLVVHVFTEEKRRFYNLERLWGDAPRVPYETEQTARAVRRRNPSARAKI